MIQLSQRVLGILGALWIACCIVFGGASAAGSTANTALQLGAVAILLLSLWCIPPAEPVRGGNMPLALLGLLAAYLLLTAIPLPPGIWSRLPGRAPIAAGYRLLDLPAPWLPVALDASRLLRSAAALLVPLATYIMFRRMADRSRELAVWAVIAGAILSVILGAMQLAEGPESRLRFYAITNPTSPVGYFANANHLATLLLVAIPFAAVALQHRAGDDRARARMSSWAFVAVAAMLTAGIVVDRSVAGLGLLLPALAASVMLFFWVTGAQYRRAYFWAGIVVAVVTGLAIFWFLDSAQFTIKWRDGPGTRALVTPTTLLAARDFLPFGSGFGSFTQVYAGYEPIRFLQATYMNHAHNDYAEVALELGLPGIGLIVAGLILFGYYSYLAWTNPHRTGGYGRAASVAIALMLAHSAVDYPLRTAAMAAIFAMAWAMLLPKRRYGMTSFAFRPDGASE